MKDVNLTLVGVGLLYQWGLVQLLIKLVGAEKEGRTRKLVWQFFFAAIFSGAAMLFFDRPELNWSVLVVAAIGAANAFACYCHWRAYAISMAKTSLLSSLDDLVVMVLGYAILGELKLLNPLLTGGIFVSILSALLFAKIKQRGEQQKTPGLMKWVLGYSTIWGVAGFSMRFFSLHGLPLPTYIAAWYVGSFAGALVTRFFIMGPEEAGPPLTAKLRGKVFILSLAVWTSLMVQYWMRGMLPITVIQPMAMVAEFTIPAIIGMVIFGEWKTISHKETLIIISGLLAISLMAVSY